MADTLEEALLLASANEPDAVGERYKFIINNELRTITVPSDMVFGVYFDRNVQTIDFEMPRYYHDLDLSDFQIRINYVTGDFADIYLVLDKAVTSTKIAFTWTVDIGAYVQNGGTVTFNVCLRKLDNDVLVKEFNTTVHTVRVLEGLEVEPADPEVVHDYLTQIQQIYEEIDKSATAMAQEIADEVIATIPEDYTALERHVSSIDESITPITNAQIDALFE